MSSLAARRTNSASTTSSVTWTASDGGSTRKRGKTWTAYFDAGDDLETGKRRQKTKGGFSSQKEAQQFLADVVTQLGHGTYSEPSKQPLATFMADEWLPAVRGQLRPLSAAKYAQVLRTHVTGRDIGSVPLRALSPGHLNGLYAELERDGLSAATRRQVHVIIGHALSDAVRWGKISRNPAKQADPPALPAPARKHGPHANYGPFSSMFRTTGCSRSGGSRRRRHATR